MLIVISNLLFFYSLFLIGRVVVEFIKMFARDWYPTGAVATILEILFAITDPPINFLRRVIPPIPLGTVRLDLSVLILLIGIFIIQGVITGIIAANQ
ncbi:YggT family protein [Hoyosella rhizosphaerae]|nr:YggT family protein [Hoyosella rhizosphaerae]